MVDAKRMPVARIHLLEPVALSLREMPSNVGRLSPRKSGAGERRRVPLVDELVDPFGQGADVAFDASVAARHGHG